MFVNMFSLIFRWPRTYLLFTYSSLTAFMECYVRDFINKHFKFPFHQYSRITLVRNVITKVSLRPYGMSLPGFLSAHHRAVPFFVSLCFLSSLPRVGVSLTLSEILPPFIHSLSFFLFLVWILNQASRFTADKYFLHSTMLFLNHLCFNE